MSRRHPPIVLLTLVALFVGLSLAGGPVLWAVMVMIAVPVGLAYLAGRAAHTGGGAADYRRAGAAPPRTR